MRRISQAPRAEHDGPNSSGVHVGRPARGYGMVMIVLAGCSVVLLTTILWSLRAPDPERGHTHQSRDPGEFLFPLYRHHRQPHDRRDAVGRRIRSDSQAFFGLHGGGRLSDDGSEIEDLYIKMELRDGKLYHFHVDTASGPVTWVNCDDFRGYGGPLKKVGPNGLYVPVDHSVKCTGETASMCKTLQRNSNNDQDCDEAHHFDCLIRLKYFDKSTCWGRVINESITLPTVDNTERKIDALFGCVYDGKGDTVTTDSITDGIIGLGNCEGTLLDQLWADNRISQSLLGLCLVKELVTTSPVGFISLGIDFEWKFRSSVRKWVKMHERDENYCAFGGKLLHIFVDRKKVSVDSLSSAMFIDTGSHLTYLTESVYDPVLAALDAYAVNRGYDQKVDNDYVPADLQRWCWEPPSKKARRTRGINPLKRGSTPIDDFGPLSIGFEGMDGAAPVQELIIQPENYLVWDKDEIKLCVNILRDDHHPISQLGADILRGYLFVFDVENQRFRWTTSTSCDA